MDVIRVHAPSEAQARRLVTSLDGNVSSSIDGSGNSHVVLLKLDPRMATKLLELFNALGEWLDEQSRIILPKSPVGQAISYARNQWQDLQTYTRDGELSIDNNVSERSVRAQAIGRKNYLFVGSDRGGRTAATLPSVM